MKWKIKYFIRGLGAGIFFTAIVMSISLQASRSRIIRENTLTKEELMEKAFTYGMVLPKDETDDVSIPTEEEAQKNQDEISNQVDSSDKQEMTPTEENSEENQEINDSKEEENENQQKDQKETETADDEQSNSNASTNDSIVSIDYVPITVTSGMTATSVSKYLKDQGIIEDSDEFRVYLTEQGYAAKIRTGDYLIPVSSTYKKIADIITRKN